MNAFWKGLVASVAVYQLVLTYYLLSLTNYIIWWLRNGGGLLNTVPGMEAVVVLGAALIALVVFNLAMLQRGLRPVKMADE
jgi:hypothetical protein